MRQQTRSLKEPAEKVVANIRRVTRKQYAHSRDRDQSFQAMVITVSMGS